MQSRHQAESFIVMLFRFARSGQAAKSLFNRSRNKSRGYPCRLRQKIRLVHR